MDGLLNDVTKKFIISTPVFKKYVDDIITSIHNDKIEETLATFNGYNTNIHFTVQREKNNSVPFDTLACRDSKIIRLDWDQKPTSSGRYINYFLNHRQKMKVNLTLVLKNRIIKISHPQFKIKNLKKKLYQTKIYIRQTSRILHNRLLAHNQI